MLLQVLGEPVKNLPEGSAANVGSSVSKTTDLKFDLDSVWNYIFGTTAAEAANLVQGSSTSASSSSESTSGAKVINLSPDAMITILCMVRAMLNMESKNPDSLPGWLKEYPVTLTQFIFYLYHNVPDFMPSFMTEEVLGALSGTLFPMVGGTPAGSPEHHPENEDSVDGATKSKNL